MTTSATPEAATHELVIRGGTIVDGGGEAARQGDVAIEGERIAAIGAPNTLRGRRILDAAGRIVRPRILRHPLPRGLHPARGRPRP